MNQVKQKVPLNGFSDKKKRHFTFSLCIFFLPKLDTLSFQFEGILIE